METRQQRLIRQALEGRSGKSGGVSGANREGDPDTPGAADTAGAAEKAAGLDAGWSAPADTTLRNKSLGRAEPDYLPRTLTAHEWEEYYREHGVPPEHRRGTAKTDKPAAKIGDLTGHRRG